MVVTGASRPGRATRWGGLAALAATAAVVAWVGTPWNGPGEASPAPLPAPGAAARPTLGAPPASDAGGSSGVAPFPDLDLQLHDVSSDGALITVATRPGRYAVGQSVFPGVVLEHVDRDTATLRFGTQRRTVWRTAPQASGGAVAAAPAAPGAPPGGARGPRLRPRPVAHSRPRLAATFLAEVQVHAHPRGGFVVDAVLPGSRYERMGLLPGDVVFTVDTPASRTVDEQSMVTLMQQTELELDIYRHGTPMRLRVALNVDPPEALPAAPGR